MRTSHTAFDVGIFIIGAEGEDRSQGQGWQEVAYPLVQCGGRRRWFKRDEGFDLVGDDRGSGDSRGTTQQSSREDQRDMCKGLRVWSPEALEDLKSLISLSEIEGRGPHL